jgi:hypothetical protein
VARSGHFITPSDVRFLGDEQTWLSACASQALKPPEDLLIVRGGLGKRRMTTRPQSGILRRCVARKPQPPTVFKDCDRAIAAELTNQLDR